MGLHTFIHSLAIYRVEIMARILGEHQKHHKYDREMLRKTNLIKCSSNPMTEYITEKETFRIHK